MSENKRYRLLLIDDDESLNRLLVDYFPRFGHELLTATSVKAGKRILRTSDPDLLILDVMLPDADGLELCRSLRLESDIPIIMLTARADVPDRVLGLQYGADDYVPKPFEPRELVARVENVMRRVRAAPMRILTAAGGLALETETRRVTLNEEEVSLTSTEFELLRILMESRGRVLTRESLLRRLRGLDADIFDRSVDMLVSRLRKKLDDDSRSPRFIKTVWRVGYQFVGKP
ncbi:MAG: response regulator transcription factor [Deltaproteobacteria bacterium]|nr:response regulator transcription factor [Deltaproteobacteria bacterium]